MLLSVLVFASLLRMIPTASLAAVLVFVGIKLVKPAEVKKLARFGKVPVLIYFASMITIVATDLLTGVLVGMGLSLLRLLYTMTHLEARVVEERADACPPLRRRNISRRFRIAGALDKVKPECAVHMHCHQLRYIDHACIEVIERGWRAARRTARGAYRDGETASAISHSCERDRVERKLIFRKSGAAIRRPRSFFSIVSRAEPKKLYPRKLSSFAVDGGPALDFGIHQSCFRSS